jgi:hypothetical protein
MKKIEEKNTNLPSLEDVEKFKMLFPLLNSDLSEVRELSKKKQDESLNKFKVRTINQKLAPIKEILKNEPTIEFLELLDDVTLPSNSDAVFMLAQFKSAMEQYRNKHYTEDNATDILSFGRTSSWKTQ